MAKPADEVTVYEAAEIIDRSHSQVTRYIADGLLPYRKVGNMYLIPRRAAEKFTPPPRGNPHLRKKTRKEK